MDTKLNTFDFVNLLTISTPEYAYAYACIWYHMTDCRASAMQELVFIAVASCCTSLHHTMWFQIYAYRFYFIFFSWILNFIKSIFFGGFLVFDMMKFSLRLFFRFEFHVMKILILICHSLKMKKKNRLKTLTLFKAFGFSTVNFSKTK